MEKLLRIVKELNSLKAHHQEVIKSAESIEVKADRLGDSDLIKTISDIREKSENSFNEIQDAIENYHLKINNLDG